MGLIDHVVFHGFSIALAIASQLFTETFHILQSDFHVFEGLFRNPPGVVSESFPLEVSMDWWAEYTWILVCVWNTAWLLYSLINVFRRNIFGPLSCNPEIHPPAFFLIWVVVNTSKIGGMFLWDQQDLWGTLFFKLIMPLYSFFMLYMSYRNLYRHRTLLAINNPKEIWYTRYMIQNGLAMFAWLTLLEALVCLGVVLKFKAGLQDPVASSLVLTLLLLGMLLWFVFESVLFTKYIRYTLTVYPVLVLSLGSMFTKGYQVNSLGPNTIYCGFLMLIATILNSVQLIAACFYNDEASNSSRPNSHLQPDICLTVDRAEGKNSPTFRTGIANPAYCQN